MKQFLILLLTLIPLAVNAQMSSPVVWTSEFTAKGDSATLTLNATIENGWHLYATELPQIDFGPSPTTVDYSTLDGLQAVGPLVASSAPVAVSYTHLTLPTKLEV